MPRPPILPTVDWRSLFERGKTFEAWLDAAENREHAERMRIDVDELSKTLQPQLIGFLKALPCPIHVVCFAEDWCGDVVRHVPPLECVQRVTPNLRTRYLAREEAPEAFVRFVTNGGEAIPKFVFLNDNFIEVGHWGPMPEACRELIARGKSCNNVAEARKHVTKQYENDPDRRIVIGELVFYLDIASTNAP